MSFWFALFCYPDLFFFCLEVYFFGIEITDVSNVYTTLCFHFRLLVSRAKLLPQSVLQLIIGGKTDQLNPFKLMFKGWRSTRANWLSSQGRLASPSRETVRYVLECNLNSHGVKMPLNMLSKSTTAQFTQLEEFWSTVGKFMLGGLWFKGCVMVCLVMPIGCSYLLWNLRRYLQIAKSLLFG